MNNEIKEILRILKVKSKEYEYCLNANISFSDESYKAYLLLDYITNLQQAFERSYTEEQVDFAVNEVKEQLKIEKQYSNQLCNEIDKLRVKNWELQQENERLKETNVYCNRTDRVGRIKDSRKYDSVYQEKEDYKSRCEKAIEYIKNDYVIIQQEMNEGRGFDGTQQSYRIYVKDYLLNILQNGSEEK